MCSMGSEKSSNVWQNIILLLIEERTPPPLVLEIKQLNH